MKFELSSRLRPAARSAGPATTGAETPGPPRPPRGRPVAAYAALLDGHTLWLAVDASPGSLALRAADGGDVHALRSDLPESDPAYRSVRVDLADLPALPGDAGGPDARVGEAAYDVVLVPPGGRAPRPVWTPPLPAAGPRFRLDAPDGVTRFELQRGEDGTLRVHRGPVPASVTLRRIGYSGGDAIRLDLATPAGVPEPAGELLLLGDDGLIASFAVRVDPDTGGAHAVVTLADIPAEAVGFARVAVGTPGTSRPVARWRNDVPDAASAVLLPVLHGEDAERPRLRFRWNPEAQLAVRLLGPETPAAQPAGTTAQTGALA